MTFAEGEGGLSLILGEDALPRLSLGAEDGGTFQITPMLPPDELLEIALAGSPPDEEGDFRPSDLVELVTLDSTIALDIRYASTNNFMGEVFYSAPRAFLQRPAAEALVRAHEWLGELGYGLLIHDGYRPWYVTKMFWDATPEDLKVFVANPENGSRHNRGAAIDLTLYDLESGEPILMPGGYDEFSPRSFPDYPGGTSRQRWHRELLREAMEAQGFAVYEAEWWHFDHGDWRRYRIGNERFEELGAN
ncbi:MAG: M15 family metallopeptidase [Planctomycetota bacterium]